MKKHIALFLILGLMAGGCQARENALPVKGKILYGCAKYKPLPNEPWTTWGVCVYEDGEVIKNFPHMMSAIWAGKNKIFHIAVPFPRDPVTGKVIRQYLISDYKTKEIYDEIHLDLESEFNPQYFFKDGKRILGKIYEKADGGTITNIGIYNKKKGSFSKLTHFEDDGNLVGTVGMSPQEDKIVFSYSPKLDFPHQVEIIDLEGNVLEKFNGREPDWSPNGSQIIFTEGSTRLILRDLNSKQNKEIAKFNEIIAQPKFSPDGKQIVFVYWGGHGAAKNLAVINTDGTGFRMLLSDKDAGGGISNPQWQE